MDANFCSHCGRRLHSEHILAEHDHSYERDARSEGAASLEIVTGASKSDGMRIEDIRKGEAGAQSKRRDRGWLLSAGLASLSVAVGTAVFLYYNHEKKVNETVLRLQSEAKAAALSGNYGKALELLSDASEARPRFTALAADMGIIQHVMELERLTLQVEKSLAVGMTEEAEKGLHELKSEFSGHKEPIYSRLRGEMDGLDLELTLQKLTLELDTLASVKELGEMLNVVNGLIGEEAASLREDIVSRIYHFTSTEVEQLLDKKNFTSALMVVSRSLGWVKEDASLLALQQKIKNEQSQYERVEQQRIEQAMQRAAQEDLINQTAAVEVVSTEFTLDEFGDLTIDGVLKNAATKAIYSVLVEFTLKSKEGDVLGKGTATATPNYIEAGEQMEFTATIYSVFTDEVVIEIDHATWYLD